MAVQEGSPLNIIVDTNVIVAALIQRGIVRELILRRPDPDDVPVVALALAVDNEGIWTFNTKDFSDPRLLPRLRILGTAEVKSLLGTV